MGDYLKISELKTLQLEPTSKCNLLCPQCERVHKGSVNPLLPLTELTPSDYDKIFAAELTKQLEHVVFNGSYGDPIASRYLDYAIESLFEKKIRRLQIFTNGSLKSASWWCELGRRFSGTRSEVVFSIDGLEDTNSIYRVNSNFKKIMKNASAYIQSGGRARWDFLVFDHNYHQLDKAKTLAQKMGFTAFHEKRTQRFLKGNYTNRRFLERVYNRKGDTIDIIKPPPLGDSKDFERVLKKYGSWNRYIEETPIHCKYKENIKALFVDFEALVWPCCWIGALTYRVDQMNPQKKQFNDIMKKYEKNFNSLRHHSLSKILSHPWFKSHLTQSWKNKINDKNPKLFVCGRTCGTDYEFTSGAGYKNSRMFVLK